MTRLGALLRAARLPWRSLSTQTASTTATASPASAPNVLQGRSGEHRPCGVLARKIGMTSLWDDEGVRHPITILCVDRNHVLKVAPPNPNDGRKRWRVQIGAGPRRPYRTRKSHRFHCAGAGVEPKQKMAEFLVHEMFKLDVGTELRASQFMPGSHVDVHGISIGKGTQGVMKRWGFAGGPATHGTSKAHRKAGSIGQSTKPGRVFKGKKMAGRMGNKPAMVLRLMVYRVDATRNLIYVRGPVPGNSGNWVRVRDSLIGLKHGQEAPPALRSSTTDVLEWKKPGLVGAL